MKLAKAIIAASILLFVLSVSPAFANGPSINLPPGAHAHFDYPGPNSYWKITLSGVDPGYDVTNGDYKGWCCDKTNTINDGANHAVTLYSTYGTTPYTHNVDPGDWNKVNYIINNPQGTKDDVQAAIWRYIDGEAMPTDPDAIAMVNAAEASGGSFVPGPGQILAVLCWISESKQTTFIEVCLPINGVIPEYPIGPILGSVSFVIALGLFKCRHALPTVFRFKRD